MNARLLVKISALAAVALLWAQPGRAHVPYFERNDFTAEAPFEVKRVEQSIAVYAWLETGDDVDVYHFHLDRPSRVYVQALVPVCAETEDLLPWFAVVGPGLPPPSGAVPFELPAGAGAVIVPNLDPDAERDTFYEPFGGKSYYDGPLFDQNLDQSGDYWIVFWDPLALGGDYTAVIGAAEQWPPADILRALILTPKIRADQELHQECSEPQRLD